jgi:hypothetical protein
MALHHGGCWPLPNQTQPHTGYAADGSSGFSAAPALAGGERWRPAKGGLFVTLIDQVLPTAYIVYCHTRTVLDRRPYPYPREQEMQREYPDYKTSLGPWTEVDIVDFFTVDYRRDESRWPFTRQAIADFFRSGGNFSCADGSNP